MHYWTYDGKPARVDVDDCGEKAIAQIEMEIADLKRKHRQ